MFGLVAIADADVDVSVGVGRFGGYAGRCSAILHLSRNPALVMLSASTSTFHRSVNANAHTNAADVVQDLSSHLFTGYPKYQHHLCRAGMHDMPHVLHGTRAVSLSRGFRHSDHLRPTKQYTSKK